MPTLVDELVVRLKLDNSAYQAGARASGQELDKFARNSQKRAAEISGAGEKAADYFARLRREIIAIGATVLVGGGFSSLLRSIVQTEAAVGRLAHSMGVGTDTLSSWQGAAKRAGGSAEATGGSLQGLTQEFQRFSLTGQSSVLPYLRFLQVAVTDTDNKIRPLNDILLDLSDRFSKMSPERATAFGSAIGLDQGTINLLMQGRAAVEKLLAAQRQLGVITKADADAGIALSNSLFDVQQAVERLARSILTELTPDIMKLLGGMRDWLAANREWLESQIVMKIREFRDYLMSIDWEKVRKGAEDIWRNIEKVVEALGGWERVGALLFTSWAAGKLDAIALAVVGIGLALANPVVLAALAAWMAYYSATERFRSPQTQEELDKQFVGLPTDSPLWRGIPSAQQFRYPNSPASRGDSDASPLSRLGAWLNGGRNLPIADDSMSQHQRGFLAALSDPESKGDYTLMNGGRERITSFAAHPGRVGQGGTSTATGRYQFTRDTWNEAANALGLTDFTPKNQDQAAWWLASREYRTKTGRDLHADLIAGGNEEKIANALRGRWPSLPGGSQSNQPMGSFIENLRRRTQQAAPAASSQGPERSIPFQEGGFILGSSGAAANTGPSSTSVSSQTNVTGPITIVTNATNAGEIAASFRQELLTRTYASQMNTGLT